LPSAPSDDGLLVSRNTILLERPSPPPRATLPTLKFSPGVHVNYAETVLPMRDGLPKLKDFPKEFGGSGEAVPE
jgi:hypothetical protein